MVGQKPIRLPPLKTLRVHNPQRKSENPCIAIMSNVLGRSSRPLEHADDTAHAIAGRFGGQDEADISRWGNLACWASAGYNATGCLAVENQLRACMDGPKVPKAPASTINYHLSRMQKYVISQPKRK